MCRCRTILEVSPRRSEDDARHAVRPSIIKIARLFVFVEAAAFVAAALTHFGVLIEGYRHRQAGTAESVIGIVLLAGWISTFIRPSWANRIAAVVQGFALFGTLVGLFTIVIGVGPRTMPDLVFHVFIVVLLVCGLIVSLRAPKAGKDESQTG